MAFEGFQISASPTFISGWVYSDREPNAELPVEIVSGDAVVAIVVAGNYLDHLQNAGKGNGRHGFEYFYPQGNNGPPLRARVSGQPWFLQPGEAAYSRLFAFLRHTCEYGFPEVPHGFSPVPEPNPEAEHALIRRLLDAYHRAIAADAHAPKLPDQWTDHQRATFPDYLELLHRRAVPELADYMRSFFAQTISHGTFQGAQATEGLRNPASARHVAAFTVDALASLAESMGLIRVEGPEQGHYGENLFRSPDDMLNAIATGIGINPVPPNVAGMKFGVSTDRGYISKSDLRALDAAYRMLSILQRPAESKRICEIGGGIGSAAYYANLLGFGQYTIIDLPPISFMQAYWLIRALPEAPISVYGETLGPGIWLLPPSEFPKSSYSLVYNQDSFPEMNREHSLAYLRQIRPLAPLLLSINQEGENPQTAELVQPVVGDLVREVGGYRRVYRFLSWLRTGYVEELFEVVDHQTLALAHEYPLRAKAHAALDYAIEGQWGTLTKQLKNFLSGR